ncbi:MAG: hypothetical protein F6K18_11845 [Okeania sp. SIO2C2]|uniref:hypothetical protein n=1 Tax=Okeania sp. SIO2C2 TaxID=2607787 RepID=UPI0013B9C98F|nr:hypothetical protein [Okeania sp. SIO2C2]NEP87461.1 hypothetical protein [Okeania sp. SIO2C2]
MIHFKAKGLRIVTNLIEGCGTDEGESVTMPTTFTPPTVAVQSGNPKEGNWVWFNHKEVENK